MSCVIVQIGSGVSEELAIFSIVSRRLKIVGTPALHTPYTQLKHAASIASWGVPNLDELLVLRHQKRFVQLLSRYVRLIPDFYAPIFAFQILVTAD